MTDYVVVYVTASSQREAGKISKALVEEGLVACCNIVSPIRSIFRWEGEFCDEREALIIAKSRRTRFKAMVRRIKELHSYDVPEIIALPIVDGSEDYLKWVREQTKIPRTRKLSSAGSKGK